MDLVGREIERIWSYADDDDDAPGFPLTEPDVMPNAGELDDAAGLSGIPYTGGTRRDYGEALVAGLVP